MFLIKAHICIIEKKTWISCHLNHRWNRYSVRYLRYFCNTGNVVTFSVEGGICISKSTYRSLKSDHWLLWMFSACTFWDLFLKCGGKLVLSKTLIHKALFILFCRLKTENCSNRLQRCQRVKSSIKVGVY